jgi:membrane-associated protein
LLDSLYHVLTGFFAHYGYWVVFFGVMLENAGIPVPGETVLIFAGFLAYQGEIHLGRAIATAVLGATLGDSLGYSVGRFGGAAFVEKYRGNFPFLCRRFDRAQALFVKYGHWAVFVGRFITGLRVFAGVLAGLFRMRYPRFLFFNFTGAVGWATTFGCVGFAFGSHWQNLVQFVKQLDRITLGVIVAALGGAGVVYFLRRRKSGS